ncbi:archease [Candidatus Poribacteria bacterium]|nr:archease [Candidatus Poribacteria bacterium]
MERYEYLEHTGDIGIRAYGGTLEELFINAAQGLLESIADLSTVGTTKQTQIEVFAESLEELMVAWLDELNFRHEVEEIFFRQVEIRQISEAPYRLVAVAYGEPVDFAKHVVYTEIKSITYHQLIVEQLPDDRWMAQVIFDL